MKRLGLLFFFIVHHIVVSAFVSYTDSLMGIGKLNEGQAMQLLDLLEQVRDENSGEDMARYCSKALTLYGWFLIQEKEWYIAGDVLNSALSYCPEDSLSLRYFIKSGLGGLYIYAREYKKAESYLLEVLNFHSIQGNEKDVLLDYFNLGTLYRHWDNKVRSLFYYRKALELAEKNKWYLYHCLLLDYMSNLEADHQVRLDMLQRSIDIAFKSNLFFQQASNLLALAQYYYRQAEYEKARLEANRVLKYTERYEMSAVKSECYQLIGQIYAGQKDYGMAYRYMHDVVDMQNRGYIDKGQKLYRHHDYAVRLRQWCADVTDEEKRPSVFSWLLTILVLLVSGGIIYGLIRFFIFRSRHRVVSGTIDDVADDLEMDRKREMVSVGNSDDLRTTLNYLLLFYNRQNELLERIKQMIRLNYRPGDLELTTSLKKINGFITQNMVQDMRGIYVEEMEENNRSFLERLEKQYPDLADGEKKLAVYLRMGLSSRDIALLTGNQLKSVNMGRYRLRKTLRLSSEDDLNAFLKNI